MSSRQVASLDTDEHDSIALLREQPAPHLTRQRSSRRAAIDFINDVYFVSHAALRQNIVKSPLNTLISTVAICGFFIIYFLSTSNAVTSDSTPVNSTLDSDVLSTQLSHASSLLPMYALKDSLPIMPSSTPAPDGQEKYFTSTSTYPDDSALKNHVGQASHGGLGRAMNLFSSDELSKTDQESVHSILFIYNQLFRNGSHALDGSNGVATSSHGSVGFITEQHTESDESDKDSTSQ